MSSSDFSFTVRRFVINFLLALPNRNANCQPRQSSSLARLKICFTMCCVMYLYQIMAITFIHFDIILHSWIKLSYTFCYLSLYGPHFLPLSLLLSVLFFNSCRCPLQFMCLILACFVFRMYTRAAMKRNHLSQYLELNFWIIFIILNIALSKKK